MTWLSSATGTGDEAELASCGLKTLAMRSAHCEGKFGAGVEQAEVARIRHLHDSVLHALEGPFEQLLDGPRRIEVHRGELLGKARHVDGRSHRACAHAGERVDQRRGEPAVEARALRGARKQRGDGGGQGMLGHSDLRR